MILAVCREYSQPPRWFYDLKAEDQTVLIADWRLRNHRPAKTTSAGKSFWTRSD